MLFTTAVAFFSIPLLASAQYGDAPATSPSSAAPASSGTPTSPAASGASPSPAAAGPPAPSAPPNSPGHINIDVGYNKGLVFNNASIQAPNGTIVTFYFPSGGPHSVTQSSFANPCTYLAANGTTPAGFDSGLTQSKQFSIKITNDAKPIWYHCKAGKHCGNGMVGAINAPPTGNTFDAFHSAALAIGTSETTETDNGPVTGGVNAQATAAPAATASANGTATGTSSGSKPTGGAAQLSVGAGAAILAIVMAFVSA